MTSYIALLRKQPRSDYGVDFPDFPGCVTAGRTLEEARRMADRGTGVSRGRHARGWRCRSRHHRPIDAIMADRHNRDAIAFLVDLPESRSVRYEST